MSHDPKQSVSPSKSSASAVSHAPKKRSGPLNLVWRLLRAVLIAWLVSLVTIMFIEDKMIFFPAPYPQGEWQLAQGDKHGPPYIFNVTLTAADGVELHGWYCFARSTWENMQDRPVFLLLHGNAGNVTHRSDWITVLLRSGADVFILDYRGYGKSKGKPNEAGVYLDAQAAWNYLTSMDGGHRDPKSIILLGESLGGAVAVDLATKVQPGGLILQSTFTSIRDMVAEHYSWVPAFLVRTKMDSLAKMPQIKCPVLVIHGKMDQIVPFAMGQRLYAAALEPKMFYGVDEGTHDDPVMGSSYTVTIKDFLGLVSAQYPAVEINQNP
ncbi:MAG: alpha/beta hydrolase [Phycisphaeraceae bacterium]|nr:alpha/beta hydrolase [Phycisphaeraceae bacterium]